MSATQTLSNPTSQALQPAPAAELQAVTKRYRNGVTALNNLSLTLYPGEIVALLGPNGAGKSTAVKLLLGLCAPTSGHAHIFGQDPRFSTNRLRTGVMLQVGKAPETLRVREHIDLFRGYYPSPLSALELIRSAGLEGLENRLFGELSGGQKQRVLFALALAGNPDLVFLDEPTVGLDIESRRSLWAQIRALAANGKTVLLTTHYLEEADALASRIIVINKGELICQGTPAQIKAHASRTTLPTFTDPTVESDTLDLSKQEPIPVQLPSRPERAAPGAEARAQADPTSTPKLIRCHTTLTPAHLRLIPGVTTVEQPPRELDSHHLLPTTLTTANPETTLREMLALDPTLSHLEVTSPALEDAFLALTSA